MNINAFLLLLALWASAIGIILLSDHMDRMDRNYIESKIEQHCTCCTPEIELIDSLMGEI